MPMRRFSKEKNTKLNLLTRHFAFPCTSLHQCLLDELLKSTPRSKHLPHEEEIFLWMLTYCLRYELQKYLPSSVHLPEMLRLHNVFICQRCWGFTFTSRFIRYLQYLVISTVMAKDPVSPKYYMSKGITTGSAFLAKTGYSPFNDIQKFVEFPEVKFLSKKSSQAKSICLFLVVKDNAVGWTKCNKFIHSLKNSLESTELIWRSDGRCKNILRKFEGRIFSNKSLDSGTNLIYW